MLLKCTKSHHISYPAMENVHSTNILTQTNQPTTDKSLSQPSNHLVTPVNSLHTMFKMQYWLIDIERKFLSTYLQQPAGCGHLEVPCWLYWKPQSSKPSWSYHWCLVHNHRYLLTQSYRWLSLWPQVKGWLSLHIKESMEVWHLPVWEEWVNATTDGIMHAKN